MQSILEKKKKILLFVDEMKVYIQNPKDTTRKLLEPINGYRKVEEYKINTHKSLALVHTHKQKDKFRKQLHSPLQQKE